jgi:hypothetical protein
MSSVLAMKLGQLQFQSLRPPKETLMVKKHSESCIIAQKEFPSIVND